MVKCKKVENNGSNQNQCLAETNQRVFVTHLLLKLSSRLKRPKKVSLFENIAINLTCSPLLTFLTLIKCTQSLKRCLSGRKKFLPFVQNDRSPAVIYLYTVAPYAYVGCAFRANFIDFSTWVSNRNST